MSGVKSKAGEGASIDPKEFTAPAPEAAPAVDVVDSFFGHVQDQIRYEPGQPDSWLAVRHYCNQHADPRLDWRWGDTSPQARTRNESAGFIVALINSKGDLDFKSGTKIVRNGMTLLVRDSKYRKMADARQAERIAWSSKKEHRKAAEELADTLGISRNLMVEESEKAVETGKL